MWVEFLELSVHGSYLYSLVASWNIFIIIDLALFFFTVHCPQAVGRHNPLGDRVLVVAKTAAQKTTGGIQSPSTAQTKPQGSEILAIEKGKTVGKAQVDVSVKTGAQIIYSKYVGTEVDLNGVSHLLLNNDGIVGILETEDVKDFKPLSERVLINVEEAEKETAGGLLLTEDSKEKPSIGTIKGPSFHSLQTRMQHLKNKSSHQRISNGATKSCGGEESGEKQ
ncbi:20 kDa chaperonin, chloroplastic-like [Papaver somniferum]|uniref:20 kDa chaperonin, chloroplastic-like n=1 Tax=Papaver somniferum TaxID=3469 RepID=UPI000E6FD41F|nr:20 kDa chaperonin, chloroplastic-like [Papaver somniferum]